MRMVRWDLLLSLQHLGSPSSGDHDVMRGGSTVAGCAHCASSAVAAGSGTLHILSRDVGTNQILLLFTCINATGAAEGGTAAAGAALSSASNHHQKAAAPA